MTDPRKATVPDPIDTMRALSAKARGELADKALGIDVVLAAIGAAAAGGFSAVAIEPPKPIDLRGTDTWKDTVAKLQSMGFSTEARPRLAADTGTGWALLVSWSE